MDCAEEVATLKHALGPIVGGAERLAFDILNGRMTVTNDARATPDPAIVSAVAATGMRAEPWHDAAARTDVDGHRRQQVLFTSASGACVLLGLILHVVLAGGFEEAWRLFATHADQPMPWPEIVSYLGAVLLGIRFVIVKAWYALRSLRPAMNLLMTVAVIGAIARNRRDRHSLVVII
jgi:Cd2+/Zn2+-exporting ATPase